MSAVAPRPIAWVTTHGPDGTNLAPFSWFQAVSADPPTVMISVARRPDGTRKDTARNVLDSGEAVVHLVQASDGQAMVDSSLPFGEDVSEPALLGLALAPGVAVSVPRVAQAVAAFECKLVRHLEFGTQSKTDVLFLEVVHVAVQDEALDARGNLAPHVALLARLGGNEYTTSEPRHTLTAHGDLQEALQRRTTASQAANPDQTPGNSD